MSLQDVIKKVIKKEYNVELHEVKLENPPKKEMGDVAFGCFILSKELKKNPAQIAQELVKLIEKEDEVDEAQAVGPYLNLKVSKDIYKSLFYSLYENTQEYLAPDLWKGKSIFVDYIWMNVWKPMHIGHMCTPNIGQAMINLYRQVWFTVISDSHIGDWGIIFWKLITAYKLWWEEKKLQKNAVDYLLELYVKITAESQNDPSLEQKSRDAFKLLSQWDSASKKLWAEFTGHTIEAMNVQLQRLGVHSDFNIWESFYEWIGLPKLEKYPDLQDNMESIVKELIEKWIAIANEDGSVWVLFDDDLKIPSCILQKRDGTHGYLASDLACLKYRMKNWSPSQIIYFVDVRQQLHFKQAFEIAKNAGWVGDSELFHAYNGFISGKQGAFSTRKGNIIKLDKLLDEAESRAKNIILEKRDDLWEEELVELSKIIGIWAIKYGHLKKSRETDMIFDWDEFMTFEGNSGPYIQYAYVRAKRILENYGQKIPYDQCWLFESKEEVELVKSLQNYQIALRKTLDTHMPHHLCAYAYELTKNFNSFYNNVHILNEENEENKILRLQLVDLFAQTLKTSFKILGIQMPERM